MYQNHPLPLRRLKLLPLLLLPILVSGPLFAQTPSATTPSSAPATLAYDVVSIHPGDQTTSNMSLYSQPSGYTATNMRLRSFISGAFGIREDLISGLPGWAETARYDINAKTVDPGLLALAHRTLDSGRLMDRRILADRFALKSHTETKQLPVYDLVITPHGPKFKASAPTGQALGPSGVSDHEATLKSASISYLAVILAGELSRTVIDKTNLTALYDLHLTWAPDRPATTAGQDNGQTEDTGPSLFSAIQDQLGLKLIPAKGPVPTLVIDHIEPPTPN